MSASPEIDRIHADHALLGMRVQVVLRLFLAVFLLLAVLFDPPASWAVLIWTVVGCYLVWAVATVFPARHPGPRTLRWAWSALFVDLAAVTAVDEVRPPTTPVIASPRRAPRNFVRK